MKEHLEHGRGNVSYRCKNSQDSHIAHGVRGCSYSVNKIVIRAMYIANRTLRSRMTRILPGKDCHVAREYSAIGTQKRNPIGIALSIDIGEV